MSVLSTSLDCDDRDVIVDLASVNHLTAQGLGVLLRAARHRKVVGSSLTVRGANGLVARVLEITGVEGELSRPPVHVPQSDVDQHGDAMPAIVRDTAGAPTTRAAMAPSEAPNGSVVIPSS